MHKEKVASISLKLFNGNESQSVNQSVSQSFDRSVGRSVGRSVLFLCLHALLQMALWYKSNHFGHILIFFSRQV